MLDVLETAQFVHGDLRTNNIMIRVDKQGLPLSSSNEEHSNIRVVDFDWAGKAHEVRYPDTRNNNIEDVKWPGDAGTPIEAGHDRLLVTSWWGYYFNEEF